MNNILRICGLFLFLVLIIMASPVSSSLSVNPDGLQEIKTDEELNQYLNNLTSYYQKTNFITETDFDTRDVVSEKISPFRPALGAMKESSASMQQPISSASVSESKGGAHEFSSTNVQVAGVDEADFVKNDGSYIYMVSESTLFIVQAYPPQSAAIVSQTSVSGTVSDLFLSGDRLVIFTGKYDYDQSLISSQYSRLNSGERTSAVVYDISDRTNPHQIREISTPGGYTSARMIGDYVYLLTAEDQGYWNPRMPIIFDNTQEISVSSIWCPPGITNEFSMNTLTSFPISVSGSPEAVSFLLGWDTTLYVSSRDIFVAYQKNHYGWNTPVFIDDDHILSNAGGSQQETVINRFAINQGMIRYEATGRVPGYLLNQFSLDQYDGNLRVATTLEDRISAGDQYSNVYVLNPDLDIIGTLERLAPGEKIYSARFIGDLLYLVTFKQTDPFFVIDLSNPNQPGILGELKIPGYSNYIHPYDETHLIGIGKDTYENSGGSVIPTGVKIALFDVSDLNNPRMVDSHVIGEKGSDSAVLSDHRAFLLDKEKRVMVLPIKEVVHTPVLGSKYDGSYTEDNWQGAYVFRVDPAYGFEEIGKVRHGSGSQDDSWWSGSTVLRSLFMDSFLYTISHNTIIGSDLKDLSSRLMLSLIHI